MHRNATLRGVSDGVRFDVRMIQVAHTSTRNTGSPSDRRACSAFNVYAEEQLILNANQSLVQEIAEEPPLAILAVLISGRFRVLCSRADSRCLAAGSGSRRATALQVRPEHVARTGSDSAPVAGRRGRDDQKRARSIPYRLPSIQALTELRGDCRVDFGGNVEQPHFPALFADPFGCNHSHGAVRGHLGLGTLKAATRAQR